MSVRPRLRPSIIPVISGLLLRPLSEVASLVLLITLRRYRPCIGGMLDRRNHLKLIFPFILCQLPRSREWLFPFRLLRNRLRNCHCFFRSRLLRGCGLLLYRLRYRRSRLRRVWHLTAARSAETTPGLQFCPALHTEIHSSYSPSIGSVHRLSPKFAGGSPSGEPT